MVPVDQNAVTSKTNPDGTTTTTVKSPEPSTANAPTSQVALLATNVKNLQLTPTKQGVPVGKPVQVTPDNSSPTKPTEVKLTPPVQADGFVITSTPLNPSKPATVTVVSVTHVADGIHLAFIYNFRCICG